MKYSVHLSKKAQKSLNKLDLGQSNKVHAWIEEYLVGCENPRAHGKPLRGDFKGKWRYRVGDYRLIADILDDVVIIEIVKVAHRKEAYE